MKKPPKFDMERFFIALSDRTRLWILNLLGDDEVCVCFFVEVLEQGQPKISRHLADVVTKNLSLCGCAPASVKAIDPLIPNSLHARIRLMGKSATRRITKIQPDLPLYDGRDCVNALKALGEDNRVRIIGLLMDAPLGVCEIARRLGLEHYNVSRHLRVLREAGLLDVEKHGREHLYVVPERIRRSRAHARVLDLGCCSFQFDQRPS